MENSRFKTMTHAADGETLQIAQALRRIAERMRARQDDDHANRVDQLLDKLDSGRMYIGFCGHFSAGKSTLVNRLCGTELLPSSPIPTSANVVAIRNGEANAQVTRLTERDGKEQVSVPLEHLYEYCKNADVYSVEISYPVPALGQHAVLLDTPGIDSTDEAHFRATESALHLADVVFYVMDYNHVQSEINFNFTKRLLDAGKPVYLLVNQIDKHREQELSFAEYRQSVEAAFRDWQIQPAGLLFLSLKHPDHPHSEWRKLQRLVSELIAGADRLRNAGIRNAAADLVQAHLRVLADRNEDMKQALIEQSGGMERASRLADELHALEAEMEQVRKAPLERWERLKREIASLLENANVTPAATRDLAQAYLETRKPGFRAGFWFGSSKTEAERKRRLAAFQQDFVEQARANIGWHLRDLLRRESVTAGVSAPPEEPFDQLEASITDEWLRDRVNEGASFSGEYTINYAKQLSADLKSLYRRTALELGEQLVREMTSKAEAEAAALEASKDRLLQQTSAYREWLRLEQEEAEYAQQLTAELPTVSEASSSWLPEWNDEAEPDGHDGDRTRTEGSNEQPALAPEQVPARGNAADLLSLAVLADTGSRRRLGETAAKLRHAGKLLSDLPAMSSLLRSIEEKAERMENNRFSIALFGAFSAGKSSFANALIGEKVLPVSPNPTTAAINRIVPPEDGWPHGTARIYMKTKEEMEDDIRHSLRALGLEPAADEPIERLIGRVARLDPAALHPGGKPHFAFLKAAEAGWREAAEDLGAELRADLSMFKRYAAEEAKSCYVRHIELYYSSPLTDQGVILVDTPGADSINARHTGVAFNYIKNADAVLFVTYYNHAFSQADREFLLQLGRVKESFELDKMFFILNAADLAASQEELEGVVAHLEANLLPFGIRNPRIYPVSSLLGLEAKQSGAAEPFERSGLARFEREFVAFTLEELSEVAIQAAEGEIERARVLLKQRIDAANADAAERERKRNELTSACGQALVFLRGMEEPEAASAELKLLQREIEELFHYVKQRTFFRFGEFYNLAFNPSALREDGRDIKQVLAGAAAELNRLLSYYVSQEVLATTLRVETFLQKSELEVYEKAKQAISAQLPAFEPELYSPQEYDTPEVQDTMPDWNIDARRLRAAFGNARQFFERGGKEQLREELQASLESPLRQYLEFHESLLFERYSEQYRQHLRSMIRSLQTELEEHRDGLAATLADGNRVQDYAVRLEKLNILAEQR
jgi:small GTP-binding protein